MNQKNYKTNINANLTVKNKVQIKFEIMINDDVSKKT